MLHLRLRWEKRPSYYRQRRECLNEMSPPVMYWSPRWFMLRTTVPTQPPSLVCYYIICKNHYPNPGTLYEITAVQCPWSLDEIHYSRRRTFSKGDELWTSRLQKKLEQSNIIMTNRISFIVIIIAHRRKHRGPR